MTNTAINLVITIIPTTSHSLHGKLLCQTGSLLHLSLKKLIDTSSLFFYLPQPPPPWTISALWGMDTLAQSWKSINTLQEGKLQFHLAGTLMELCETGIEAPMKLWMADPAAPLSLLSHFRMSTYCQRLSSKNWDEKLFSLCMVQYDRLELQ